jgi:tetratricopeptide (TPR) repeat protein
MLEQRSLSQTASRLAIANLIVPSSYVSRARAYVRRGPTLLRRLQAAAEVYRQALNWNPSDLVALEGLCEVYFMTGDFDRALDCCRTMLRVDRNADAYNAMGSVLFCSGQIRRGVNCFLKALQEDPEHSEARFNLSIARLLKGDLTSGFEEYEIRFDAYPALRRPRQSAPEWKGQDLNGDRILLYAEQGLGDTIQFVRYAALVGRRGGRVVLEVQPALRRLLSGMACVERVITSEDDLGDVQWQCSLLSLPSLFKTSMDTIPAEIPYLYGAARSPKAGPLASSLNVGLVWQGGRKLPRDLHRSICPAEFAPLLDVKGANFYSLQKDPCGDVLPGPPLPELLVDCVDFADTARVLGRLDLVITVDTAMAHLTGAMGVPVWILLPHVPDWRWLMNRADSPWYPTARLFRQPVPGAWKPVLLDVAAALENLVDRRG